MNNPLNNNPINNNPINNNSSNEPPTKRQCIENNKVINVIDVYSFGLHPISHEPSGTANFSRIIKPPNFY